MSAHEIVPIVAGAVCFTVFGAGLWTVFPGGDRNTLGLRLIAVGAVVSAVCEVAAMLWASDVPPWRSTTGVLLFAGSLLMFLAAARATRHHRLTPAFSADTPDLLVRSGPFRVVRHPFYTSYLLAYVAGWAVSLSPVLLVVIAGMGALYGAAARQEEQKFRRSALADEYAQYTATTGRFVPSRRLVSGT